ncbi:hypothetical protein [Solilutibacter tolerans]|uniref:Uncharacterized protein n=1 Tax=Solilutibacter tolerans TaxID=1604334 RepID=A0A1N6TRW8_9GAMM|nr:hypothetical protein [Lysobacter tolerans]SIQ56118.1 hypothetical protein SAMN05421546_1452 [Lysobacter tolerans]
MSRARNLSLGLAATAGIAGGGWWWQTRQAPEPKLRDPAKIEAAMRPTPKSFVPRKQVAAPGCPMPTQIATPALPAQSPVPTGLSPFKHPQGRLQPLAGFSVDARVLSSRRYQDDREAEFSPVDLALGWGRMRDDDVLSMLQVGQQNRWYYTRWTESPPIPINQVRLESANMHMIPANRDIAQALSAIKPGQRVRIDGWLVEVQAKDGWRWRSSTTRSDHGPGGCEVIQVCAVAVE